MQSHEDESSLIAAAQREAEALASSRSARPTVPAVVPGYRIVREIGHGGMGVIYEARQEDPPRLVALKVMRARGGRDKVHRQLLFRREAETLARLNCPNIASIFGAGTTADGHHFFAMELVRGMPMTEYFRLNTPPLRELLRLFLKVCEAVQYAHQRGVIHRDLKPSNIIVDGEGNPKIVDFGLARLTDADETAPTPGGAPRRIIGTLPYMSPEQIAGLNDEVDIRADVYALGVILYELLTDRLPHDVSGMDPDHAAEVISRQNVNWQPGPRGWLKGDLLWIVRRALALDPAERYQSAAAFADDLQRLLDTQPVLARPIGAVYYLRKLIQRQLAGVIVLVVFIALLATYAVEMNNRVVEAKRLQGLLEDRSRTAAVIESIARGKVDYAASRLQNLAEQFAEQGNYDAAAQVYRDCLDLRGVGVGESEWTVSNVPNQLLVADTSSRLGACLVHLGEFERAEPLLLESAATLADLSDASDPRTWAAFQRLVDLYNAWGNEEQLAEWRTRLAALGTPPQADPPPETVPPTFDKP